MSLSCVMMMIILVVIWIRILFLNEMKHGHYRRPTWLLISALAMRSCMRYARLMSISTGLMACVFAIGQPVSQRGGSGTPFPRHSPQRKKAMNQWKDCLLFGNLELTWIPTLGNSQTGVSSFSSGQQPPSGSDIHLAVIWPYSLP
jgi:hypothetical protein